MGGTVSSDKYDSVVAQLKGIGEIQSFSESSEDVTGTYTNTEIELATEKERLTRYQGMYKDATLMADKIDLNDKMFDQERRIKYLEESLKNTDSRIEYTTITYSISEKQSNYANVTFVKFSELVRSIVDSFNNVLKWIFILIPYAIVVGIIVGVRKFIMRNDKRKK